MCIENSSRLLVIHLIIIALAAAATIPPTAAKTAAAGAFGHRKRLAFHHLELLLLISRQHGKNLRVACLAGFVDLRAIGVAVATTASALKQLAHHGANCLLIGGPHLG